MTAAAMKKNDGSACQEMELFRRCDAGWRLGMTGSKKF